MTFSIYFVYDGIPTTSCASDFLPRIGDTIVSNMEIPYLVTEVRYYTPKANEKSMAVIVYAERR